MVVVLSGKGGVGKTNLVSNLAVAAARLSARVLLVDGDLGLANVDVLLGLAARWTAADVLEGRCQFDEALATGPCGVHILPAASGRADLPARGPRRLVGLLTALFAAAPRYDLVLVDAGAGVGPAVVTLAGCCRRALLVTTPEPTSFADAYATLKVLRLHVPKLPVDLIVNEARNEVHARDVHTRLARLASRFLGVSLAFRGFLPHDRRIAEAVAQQRAVVEAYPTAASSRKLIEMAQRLLHDRARGRDAAAPASNGAS